MKEVASEASESPSVPVIAGSFTNWQPKKMTEVVSFCNKLTVMYSLKEKMLKMILSKFSKDHAKPEPAQTPKKEAKQADFDWKNILIQSMGGYKHPAIIHGQEIL